MGTPSEMLEGQIINGWNVLNTIGSFTGATGGHFSAGYIVERDGTTAFLKAMDLHSAARKGLNAISEETSQFIFERDLMSFCADRRLSRIIKLIDCGEFVPLSTAEKTEFNTVYYMVFELADGDIRRELTLNKGAGANWKLRILHHVAVGVSQLHGVKIAHQDVKPSNVLAFNLDSSFKLTDLGRSSSKTFSAPTDKCPFPGDYNYAPPEYHFGFVPPNDQDRRQGSDAYLLGSLISFLFCGLGAFMATLQHAPIEYRPGNWQGNFSDVLPFWTTAHSEATLALSSHIPDYCREDLISIYFQLCHPDPSTRGHPRARARIGRPLGLERYISRFDAIAKKTSISERLSEQKIAR